MTHLEKYLRTIYEAKENGGIIDIKTAAIDVVSLSKDYETETSLMENWINVTEKLPEKGYEVLLYNKKWIDEDFNPKGVRVGFLTDLLGWISAYWCNYHEEYHTRTSDELEGNLKEYKSVDQIPTHWKEINL